MSYEAGSCVVMVYDLYIVMYSAACDERTPYTPYYTFSNTVKPVFKGHSDERTLSLAV